MTASVNVDALNMRLQASLGKFERGLEKARRKMNRESDRMERRGARLDRKLSDIGARFGRKLLPSIGALTAALGAGALLRRMEGISRALDNIGKTADKLGLTTNALQELRAVGVNAGVAIGRTDDSIRLLQRNLSDFRDGVGEAKGAFEELGITGVDVEGRLLSTEEVLNQVADGFARIEDPAKRTQLAMRIFGRSGDDLINVLKNGSAALDRNRKAIRENGDVIEESLIRKSAETVTKLGELERKINVNLARAFGTTQPLLTAWQEVLVAISGAAASASTAISNLGTAADNVARRSGNAGRRSGAGVGRRDPRTEVERFQRGTSLAERRRALVARLNAASVRTPRRLGGRAAQDAAQRALREFDQRFGGLNAGDPRTGVFGSFSVPTAESVSTLPPARPGDVPPARTGGGGGGATPPRSFADLLGESTRRARDLERERMQLGLSQREAAALAEEFRIIDALVSEYGDNLDRAAEIGVLPEDFREQVQARAEAYAREEQLLERNRDQIERNEDAYARAEERALQAARAQQQLFEAIATGIGDAIRQADSLEDALRRVGTQVLALGVEGLFGQGQAGGFFNQLFGVAANGIVGLLSGGGAPITSPLPVPRPRALGGPAMRGRPYVVGDGGEPELFVPDQRGRIVPSLPRANGGSTSLTFAPVISIQGDASETTVRMIDERLRESEARMAAAVPALAADGARRGGSVSRTIRGLR